MAVRDCHDLAPFATACWTNAIAPFGPREGDVDEGLFQPEFASGQQVFAERPQYAVQHPRPLPLRDPALRSRLELQALSNSLQL
ncbi:hypothetical protein [Edaphobacter bradus]|uniref:hypothetical protein n=1 Tax=Edaphobacter bradus TaxID=2259016 RepID=UPI0021DF4614|nr:hypothetical protein [Edaphobacter bradus]